MVSIIRSGLHGVRRVLCMVSHIPKPAHVEPLGSHHRTITIDLQSVLWAVGLIDV